MSNDSWGLGIWDNEDASDFLNLLWSTIEKKYFTSGGEIKKNISRNSVLAIGDFIIRMDKITQVGRPSEKIITAVYGCLTERLFTSNWAEKEKRRKQIKKVIDGLNRILNT